MLEKNKHPHYTYETAMVDLSEWKDEWGQRPYRDREPELGDTAHIVHPRFGIDIRERIVKIERYYDEDKRHRIGIELAEKKRSWSDLIRGMKNEIRSLHRGQGVPFSIHDNLDQEIDVDVSASMSFYLDRKIEFVNEARLFYTGSERQKGTELSLPFALTVTVNGSLAVRSDRVQQEVDIGDYLRIGEQNRVVFEAEGPIRVEADLVVRCFIRQ
ncbi:hypothetical protein CHM34_04030 [Paludifilum halophilum]|uniref:Tail spike domain-containing protein n=1 Tax=Paludifilum halophilum TaxID=1642702 RepID=A0A235B9Q1_9BACL|nr:hypothetical protein CHM34_04030 [Paludifilum halophilum]